MKQEINVETKVEKANNKYIHLELLRIIACFFVIFNHTGVHGYSLFSLVEINSFKYWIYLFISICCKVSVPLFFAISGALLLKKEETIKDIWRKRIFKTLLILIVWSYIYYLYEVFIGKEDYNLSKFLLKLYYENWNFSYWYLYCYIGFLISLPFLKAMVKKIENKEFNYLFIIALLIYAIIPTIQYLITQNEYKISDSLELKWITSYSIIYPCLGYFLEHRINNITKKKLLIMWIINILTICISCYMSYYKAITTNQIFNETFHDMFNIINCTAIYITVKYLINKIRLSENRKKDIISIGNCTLGIYLIHIFFMRKFNIYLNSYIVYKCILKNDMIVAFMFSLITMWICYIIILLIKKIPVLRKIV